ncbi:hypothetical protein PMAYCL1PPCAC_03594, partial [Pristionchus mayeri]
RFVNCFSGGRKRRAKSQAESPHLSFSPLPPVWSGFSSPDDALLRIWLRHGLPPRLLLLERHDAPQSSLRSDIADWASVGPGSYHCLIFTTFLPGCFSPTPSYPRIKCDLLKML